MSKNQRSVDVVINQIVNGMDEVQRLQAIVKELSARIEQLTDAEVEARSEAQAWADAYNDLANSDTNSRLQQLENIVHRCSNEFKAFLTASHLDYKNDEGLATLVENVDKGVATVGEAITQVKMNYEKLLSIGGDGKLNETFNSDILQQFSSNLTSVSDSINEVLSLLKSFAEGAGGVFNGVASSGAGGAASTIMEQIRAATEGMTEEARAAYEPITSLVTKLIELSGINPDGLRGVAMSLRSLADITAGGFSDRTLNNISDLILKLQAAGGSQSFSLAFNVSGLSNLSVRKNTLDNLATYLPQIAMVDITKLKELSEINWSNLNSLQVKSSSYKSVTEFAKALEALIRAKSENIKVDAETQARARATKERDDSQYYTKLTRAVNAYISSMKQLIQIGGAIAPEDLVAGNWTADVNNGGANVEARVAATNKLRQAVADLISEKSEDARVTEIVNRILEEYKIKIEDVGRAQQNKNDTQNDGNKILKTAQDAYGRATQALINWSRAEHSRNQGSRDAYNNIKITNEALYDAIKNYDGSAESVDRLKTALKNANEAYRTGGAEIRRNGDAVQSLGDKFKKVAERFSMYLSTASLIMRAIRVVRQMITNSVELDKAFASLKIITGATDEEMSKFADTATRLAKSLGQSITDVTKSIETFSRLGYSLEDASRLAEYATMMANVAGTTNEEATTGLTAIIKGFNFDVGQAEHVADVLVEVGQKYAVSASEMMEAYEKSGAALNATNTSFERSAGLIAAANASVQNASTVGTALKTVSARIRGSKTDLEELGEGIEDLADGFSKYAKELNALTGFSIIKEGTTNEFKDLYEIFDGLAAKWDELSDTQQARVAEILGGTRQLQVIASILGNWGDAVGAYNTAINSVGAATKANDIYMETAAAHIQQFKATFQELSRTLISSNLIKDIVDIGATGLKVLNVLIKFKALIPAILVSLVAYRAVRSAIMATKLLPQIIAERGMTQQLALSVRALTAAQRERLITQIQAQVGAGRLTAAEAAQAIATIKLTTANAGLATSFKSVTASIPVWGWIALGITTVLSAITLFTNAVDQTSDEVKTLSDCLDDLDRSLDSINNTANTFASLRKSTNELIPRFLELAKGVDKLGGQGSLTNKEYEEFLELNNKIAEMFPELNLGMDENGNAMLALSYASDTLRDSLEATLEAERQLSYQKIVEEMPEAFASAQASVDKYTESISQLKEAQDLINSGATDYEALGRYGVYSARKIFGKEGWLLTTSDLREELDYLNDIEAALQQLQVDYKHLYNYEASMWADDEGAYKLEKTFTEAWNPLMDYFSQHGFPLEALKISETAIGDKLSWEIDDAAMENVNAAADKLVAAYERRIEAIWNKLRPSITAYLQTNPLYIDLSDPLQYIVTQMTNSIDISQFLEDDGQVTSSEILEYINNSIINPLYSAEADVGVAFTELMEQFTAGEIPEEEFRERISGLLDGVLEDVSLYGEDTSRAFINQFLAAFGGSDIESAFAHLIDLLINGSTSENAAANATRKYKEALGDLSSEIKTLKSNYDLMNKAQDEMSKNGGLSPDLITEFASANEDYLDYLYEENGQIKLNTEAWKAQAELRMSNHLDELRASSEELAAEKEILNTKIAQTEANLSGDPRYQQGRERADAIQYLERLKGELSEVDTAILQNQSILGIYEAIFEKITEAASEALDGNHAYDHIIDSFSGIADKIKSVSDEFKTLAEMQQLVGKNFRLSQEEALKYAEIYPEILDSATVAANGELQLNETVVNDFIKGKRAELEASVQSKIDELTARKQVMTAIQAFAQEELRIATLVAEGEGKLDFDVNQLRLDNKNALVDALIKAGISEVDAQKMAAEAMAGNYTEVDKVAANASIDIATNLGKAANSAADSVHKNMHRSKQSVASLATQAGRTAHAIRNMMSGAQYAYDDLLVPDSGGGAGYDPITTSVYNGSFNGVSYTYTPQTAALHDFIAQLTQEIADYGAAINQLDGQIALLQALKDHAFDIFSHANANSGGSSGSGSGSGGGSGTSDPSWFETQYKLYQHLLAMDAAEQEDYINWLSWAYQEAFNQGIITLDEFFKYQEEVFNGMRNLFKDYLNDLEHQISMREHFNGETAAILELYQEMLAAVEEEIARAREQGLDDNDSYLQELQEQYWKYHDAIEDLQNSITENAQNAVDDLIQIRIKMLKDEIQREKDAINERLKLLRDFYSKQKEMLRDQYNEEKYLREQSDKRKKIEDILAELAQLEYDNSAWAQRRKLELQQQLAEAQAELDEFEHDHALEMAEDELDHLQEMQEEELNNQLDALEEHENDAQALYQQALEDIKNGSIELYEEMIEWNQLYGDGIEDTIKDAWEAAYQALQDYMDLYGEYYQGIHLGNATGYDPGGTWDDHPIHVPPSGSGQTSSDAPTPPSASEPSSSSTPAMFPYGKASDTTGTIKKGSRGDQVKAIQYALNMLGFGNSGTQSVDGIFGTNTEKAVKAFQRKMKITADGIVGNKTRHKFAAEGYRSGTKYATPGLHPFEEDKLTETVFESKDGSRYKMFTGGEKVLNAKASDFLYKFAMSGGSALEHLVQSMFGQDRPGITPPIKRVEINMGDIVVQGSADHNTVSEIRRAQRESITRIIKEFNKLSTI